MLKAVGKWSWTLFLPSKTESHHESAWWNKVFVFSQNYLGIPQTTIKATVLIETITAAFQMDEIIYSLKEHMAGLNCGRWDYIFHLLKSSESSLNLYYRTEIR